MLITYWKRYLLTLITILFSFAFVLFFDIQWFSKVDSINYFNFVLEFLLAIFALVFLFAIQQYKSKDFYWPINIGFYLLFFSYYVDAMDQLFIHTMIYTLFFEKLTLVAAAIFILIGSHKWMKDFEKISLTDELTNIPNRRLFQKVISREILFCLKHEVPLCLVIIDIDYFKKINDEHGHYTGDMVLKSFATLLNDLTGGQDSLGRWGGEEFLVLLKGVDLQKAIKKMIRTRSRISEHDFDGADTKHNLTVSMGIAQLAEGDDFDLLFIKADKALYTAKESGRDTVKPSIIPAK